MTVNSKLSYLYSVVKMLFFLLCIDHIVSKFLICLDNCRYSLDLLHCKHSRFWSVSLIQEDDITQF